MPRQLFITGTDTGVGKTVVSGLLCAVSSAWYWKPIQTGAKEGNDRTAIMHYAELSPEKTLPETYCFDQPVSPHLAACWAGIRIEIESIPRLNVWGVGTCMVEGAGGVLVPLNDRQFMTDLMRWLGLPVLLTCKSGLGTINHTLLSLAALRASGLEVCGVVMVGSPNPDNRQAIERYGSVQVVGCVPWLQQIDRSRLLEVFRTSFDPHLLNTA